MDQHDLSTREVRTSSAIVNGLVSERRERIRYELYELQSCPLTFMFPLEVINELLERSFVFLSKGQYQVTASSSRNAQKLGLFQLLAGP